MKLIKRYANRKLYDTERSCYVTLDEIADMVRHGEDISIVDNRNGDDLTTVTLAQIVYEVEKRERKLLPLQSLRMIIQSPAEFIARIGVPVGEFREGTKQRVESWRREAGRQQKQLIGLPLRHFVDDVQAAVDALRGQLDKRLKSSANSASAAKVVASEIQAMRSQLERLEQDVADLRAAIDEGEPTAD